MRPLLKTDPMRRLAVAGLTAVMLSAMSSCAGGVSPLQPSGILLPDAVTLNVGDVQTFTVQYAQATSFSLRGDAPGWRDCVLLQSADPATNSVSVIVAKRCGGTILVSANIGAGHSPLVSAIKIH